MTFKNSQEFFFCDFLFVFLQYLLIKILKWQNFILLLLLSKRILVVVLRFSVLFLFQIVGLCQCYVLKIVLIRKSYQKYFIFFDRFFLLFLVFSFWTFFLQSFMTKNYWCQSRNKRKIKWKENIRLVEVMKFNWFRF